MDRFNTGIYYSIKFWFILLILVKFFQSVFKLNIALANFVANFFSHNSENFMLIFSFFWQSSRQMEFFHLKEKKYTFRLVQGLRQKYFHVVMVHTVCNFVFWQCCLSDMEQGGRWLFISRVKSDSNKIFNL